MPDKLDEAILKRFTALYDTPEVWVKHIISNNDTSFQIRFSAHTNGDTYYVYVNGQPDDPEVIMTVHRLCSSEEVNIDD